jgi:hypothetical protein
MNAKMFAAGFVSALILITLLLVGATQLHRSTAAVIVASAFKSAPATTTPFTDIENLTPLQFTSIEKLYGLHITAGTTATTFSPDLKTSLYQWFLFVGKALMVSG